jgi:hypothetical protein
MRGPQVTSATARWKPQPPSHSTLEAEIAEHHNASPHAALATTDLTATATATATATKLRQIARNHTRPLTLPGIPA